MTTRSFGSSSHRRALVASMMAPATTRAYGRSRAPTWSLGGYWRWRVPKESREKTNSACPAVTLLERVAKGLSQRFGWVHHQRGGEPRVKLRRCFLSVSQSVSRCVCSPVPRQRRTLPEDGAWLGYVTPGRWPPPHALKSRKARNQSIQRSPPVPLPSTWFLSL